VFIILSSCMSAAVAAWLWGASVHIIAWPETGPHRIAVFAPQYRLVWLISFALTAAAAIVVVTRRSPSRRERLAYLLAPLSLLWIWTIPYLPWLPDRYPLLLALAGPVRWLVLAAAVAGLAWRAGGFALARRLVRADLPGAGTVFLISVIAFGVMGWRSYSAIGITGDEPHYLVIAHSLLADRDLKIENNHTDRDYRSFFGGTLRPDYLRRGINGQIYSIHAPGLPALLLPAYAAAGARGAVLTVALLAALAAVATFKLAELIGGRAVAWLTWTSVALTVPVLPHAWSIYPEAAALAIVAWAALWLASPAHQTPVVWVIRGAVLSLLPWLHTKLVVFLGAFAVWLLIKLRRQIGNSIAVLAPITLSAAGWLAFFYSIYGTFDPQAPYGGSVSELTVANIPRSVLGLLGDQKFGLLAYAPVYLFAAAGAWYMWRDRHYRPVAAAFIATTLAYVASSGRLYMWWGGSSAPARFLVPVVPLLAAMLAFAFARLRSRAAIGVVAATLVLSVALAARVLLDLEERMLFNDPRGVSRLAEDVQGSAPLTAALPSFTQEDWTSAVRGVVPWVLAAVAAGAAGWPVRSRGVLASLAVQTLTFALVASMLAGPVAAGARQTAAARGGAALLETFDPDRARAFEFSGLSKLSPDAWLRAARIDVVLDPPILDPQGRLSAPFSLPPGRYQARVWFRGDGTQVGDLELRVRRDQVLARQTGPLSNPTQLTVDLPLGLPAVWLQLTDRNSAQAAVRFEVDPHSVVARGNRPSAGAVAADVIAGRPGAYLVYADRNSYPEGGVFWTRGTQRGRVLIAPAGASTLALTLHAGPNASLVELSIGSTTRQEHLSAGETREVVAPIPAGTAWLSVAAKSSAAFVPAAADPASSDGRSLGSQVRVGLR
jgi:hypothetical protein